MSLEERVISGEKLHVIIPSNSDGRNLQIKLTTDDVCLIDGGQYLTIGSYERRTLQRTPFRFIALNPYLFIISMITASYMMGGTAMTVGICLTLPTTLFMVSYVEIHDALRAKKVEAKLRAAGAEEADVAAAKAAARYWS